MSDGSTAMGVQHVRLSNAVPVPRLVRPRHHLIHVAFDNRIVSSDKRIDGRAVQGHAGRIAGRSMILPAGSEMYGWTIGDFDFLRLELHPAALIEAAEDSGLGRPADLKPRVQLDDPVLWHLACALRADTAAGQPGGRLFRDGVQRLIAHHLATARLDALRSPRAPAGALTVPQLRKVREFVRENLHRDLRLSELACVAGLSRFHFARAFKAAAGASPHSFVLEERLTVACRLLEATDLAIGEIAASTGFQSLTGFGVAFRKRWGVAPSRYRRSVRG